jgi:nuclear transport factor 2 (NTF2) superfamily protein
MSPRLPVPPFTWESATQKVRSIEDSWNGRKPTHVALRYTIDSVWRNGIEFLSGRAAIEAFLTRIWRQQLEYRLVNEVWAFTGNRIALRYASEYHDENGNWFRSYGNEHLEMDPDGLIRRRMASFNNHLIHGSDRIFRWPLGRRPDDQPELGDFDL